MRKALLLLLIIASVSFGDAKEQPVDAFQKFINSHENFTPISTAKTGYCKADKIPLEDIKALLYAHSDTLNIDVIQTVLAAIKCVRERDIQNSNILTIIDYSLPSSQKRLWIFDLQNKELLFYTYVSHGIRSGTLDSIYFSNKVNDKTSSLGVFITGDAYYGRHGLSLRLSGLETNFNDRANQRSIVLHASWYADEKFISKYGRVGRSWGCPVVPENLVKPIIDLIKGQSLFVAYYPSSQWFLNSKFLNCPGATFANSNINLKNIADTAEDDFRGEIIFVDKNNDNKRQENEPVLVMLADDYQHVFNNSAPLKRMLRAQINNSRRFTSEVQSEGCSF